jgi:hypothetical protein
MWWLCWPHEHPQIAQRLGATLVTFDRRMAVSARALGALVATP